MSIQISVKKSAVCIWCGSWKEEAWSGCPKCGKTPRPGTEDEIRSVYLSLGGFDGGNARDNRKVLKKISDEISGGGQVEYDEADLARLREQRRMVNQIGKKEIAIYLFRWCLPASALLVFMWLLLQFLRSLKG